jgi:hypothetical protein
MGDSHNTRRDESCRNFSYYLFKIDGCEVLMCVCSLAVLNRNFDSFDSEIRRKAHFVLEIKHDSPQRRST